MKHYLLNHQPQKGLQAACAQQGQAPTCNARGKGHTSASPKTLTKIILVLLTMILLPSAAWGQDITIAGIEPNGDGKFINGTTSQQISGVLYNSESNTLTLTNAIFAGQIVWSKANATLIIEINGSNEISNTEGSVIKTTIANNTYEVNFKKGSVVEDSKTLILRKGGSGPTIEGFAYNDANQKGIGLYQIKANDGFAITTKAYELQIGINGTMTWVHNLPEYTNIGYKNDIFGEGQYQAVFDDINNKLTLKNATINSTSSDALISGLDKLTIDLVGSNSITAAGNYYAISGFNSSTYMVGSTGEKFEIEISTSTTTGQLTLTRGSDHGLTNNVNVSYKRVVPTFSSPTGATSLETASVAFIAIKQYNLTVAGVPVTSANCEDILDGNNARKVSFTPAEGDDFATLTLNNATLNGGIIWNNGSNALIVKLDGMNYIETSTNDPAFKATASCDLYIKKNNPDNDATVKFSGSIVDFNSQPDDGFKQIFDAITPCSYYTTKTVYGISIGGTDLHDISDVNGYLNTSTGAITGMDNISFALATVSPDAQTPGTPATLTLDGATINGPIKSSIDDLHIHLIGSSNTMSGISPDNNPFQYTGNLDTSILTFESEEEDAGELTMTGIGSMDDIATYSKVKNIGNNGTSETFTFYDYENGYNGWIKGVYSTLEPKEVVLYRNISYNLWAISESGSETRYTKNNKTSIEGAPSYDPKNHALDVSTHTYSIKSSLPELILLLSGQECKLPKVTFAPIKDVQESGTLTISKKSDSGSEQFAITLGNDTGTDPVISGFSSILHTGFTFLKDGSEYDTNSKKLVDANGDAVTSIDLKYNVTLSNVPNITRNFETGALEITNSNPYEFTTTKYSIIYADGSDGVTDATYSSTEAPVLDKPATVTAYVQLNEVKSEVAKAKYFGLKKETVTMAVGDNYTSENPLDILTPAIEEGDGIYYSFSTDNVDIINCEDNGLKAVASGTAQAFVIIEPEGNSSNSGVSVLYSNESLLLTVNVGAPLNEVFKGSNEFGSFYNTSETTYAVPEDMKAYVITGADPETGKVTTAETTVLPPNTPVLLEKGSAKAFTYIQAKSGTAPSGNILLYTGNTDVQATEGSNLYVLYNDKFVKVTTGTRILSQKCYLKLNTSSGTRSYYDIDGSDGTTGIRKVKSEGVKGEKWADDGWHDLQGRRLSAKPTKPGLYILNGKKVAIK